MQQDINLNILDMDLDFKLEEGKYYITLFGKNLKTKGGFNIYCKDLNVLNKLKEDFKDNKFNSKWLNLISNYVDFTNSTKDIQKTKKELISYLKNDLLLYLDPEDSEYFNFQNKVYLKLIKEFCSYFGLEQAIVPTTVFSSIKFEQSTINTIENTIDNLSLRQLFVCYFFAKISTSAMLALLFLKKQIDLEKFYQTSFYAEIDKQQKSKDLKELERLNSIKEEISMLFCFFSL